MPRINQAPSWAFTSRRTGARLESTAFASDRRAASSNRRVTSASGRPMSLAIRFRDGALVRTRYHAPRRGIDRLFPVCRSVPAAVIAVAGRLLLPRWRPTSLGRPLALSNLDCCQSFFCALSAILPATSFIAPLALPTAF
jgi:hypothetical protein